MSGYEFQRAIDRLEALRDCCAKSDEHAALIWKEYWGGRTQIAADLAAVLETVRPSYAPETMQTGVNGSRISGA